jgi:hypothetical protein
VTENALRSRDGDGHGSEFAKHLLPFSDGDSVLLWGDAGKNGVQSL